MALKDTFVTFEEEWFESDRKPFVFLLNLRNDGKITPEEWTELRQELEVLSEDEVEALLPVLTLTEKVSLALFERIAPFFNNMWSTVWRNLGESFEFVVGLAQTVWRKLFTLWSEKMFKTFIPNFDKPELVPKVIQDEIDILKQTGAISSFIVIMGYTFAIRVAMIANFIPTMLGRQKRELNKVFSPEIPDINTLTALWYKTPEDRETVYEKGAENGYNREEVDAFVKAAASMIGPQELRDLHLRGLINDEFLFAEMEKQGFSAERTRQLKELFFFIPGPSDLVRFSVREAFSPEFIQKFGLLDEFPEQFAEQAEKVGVSRFWAEKFWAAHWVLPSIQLGFEMLHREVITDDELAGLFTAADIMPFWRDKLKAVSFNPLTRVDVRRMHKIGVLDRDAVKKAYKDVGYNDENAEKMTEFTIKFNNDTERDLTKADVLGAYQRRMIPPGEAGRMLQELGYDVSETALLITKIDHDLEKKKKTSVLRNLEKGYKKGIYSLQRVQTRMNELNVGGTELEEIISLWDAEKSDDSEPLTKADLTAMAKKKIIDVKEFKERLAGLHYSPDDIKKLVKLAGLIDPEDINAGRTGRTTQAG